MNRILRRPAIMPAILASIVLPALATPAASASESGLRITPQITFGTAGFEPGVALEWRRSNWSSVILRPEIFISEDNNIGGGGSVLFDITSNLGLNRRMEMAVGPRAVFHNADDHGWEGSAMVTWGYDLVGGARPWRHSIGALGALGAIHDRDDSFDLGFTLGAYYSYAF